MNTFAAGLLSRYLLYSLILTLPASLLVLWLYRRALLRGMMSTSDGAAATSTARARRPRRSDNLACTERATVERVERRLALAYSVAGAAFAVVSSALLFGLEVFPFAGPRLAAVTWAMTWPIVAALPVVLALGRRRSLTLAIAWLLSGGVLVAISALVSSRTDIGTVLGGYLTIVALLALPPWLIALVTGVRRLRATSPLVLTGLLVFSFGALLLQHLFVAAFRSEVLRERLLSLPYADTLWFALGALPVGVVCWITLKGLARLYDRRTFSDVQLQVDLWWLFAAFTLSTYMATTLGWPGLAGLIAFPVYRLALELQLRYTPPRGDEPSTRPLLLLRVFGHRRRTERLFDAVARRWRLEEAVHLISGTDLAGRTTDPAEIVRYLAGDLGRQFIGGGNDLDRRVASLEVTPDPDGRYRINDLSCHDDTWRAALGRLVEVSRIVLMDLRGFTKANSGCEFELEQLALRGRLDRTLFVIDSTTDLEHLRAVLPAGAEIHLASVEHQSERRLAALRDELASLA